MRNNMMNVCRQAVSTMPGVESDVRRAVSEMRLRTAGSDESTVTETLADEQRSAKGEFRSWTFERI